MNMFSKESINTAVDESKERQKKAKQILMPKGFNILVLKEVEYRKTRADDPMYVLHFSKKGDKEEKYKDIQEYIVIQEEGLKTKTGVNMNVLKMVSFFLNSFGYTLKEPDTEDPFGDITKQLKKFEGKEFRTIIIWRKSLNQKQTTAFVKAEISFDRSVSINDTSLKEGSVNPDACNIDLSPRDKAILKGDILPKGDKPKDDHGTPKITDDAHDDLPF